MLGFGNHCCCTPCAEPDACDTADCEVSETEWVIGDGFDAFQNVRWSASIFGLYSMDGVWEQDTAKGADAPSVKFNGEYTIDTSGVTGSLTVIEYLLFDEVFTPTFDEPISTVQVCANAYGLQRFTAEDGTKTNYPIIPAIIIKQDGKLFINYGTSPGPSLDYRCFSQWSKTLHASNFQRLIVGESDTSLTSEQPDFSGYGEDIQFGIGLFHQINVAEAGTSNFKSLVASAHFDNLCLNVTRSTWICFPRCPDESDLVVTISGSSASYGGTCTPAYTDTDGTFVCVPGNYGTFCLNSYGGNPHGLIFFGTLWWDCTDGNVSRGIAVAGEYPNALAHPVGGDGSIDVWLYFRASGHSDPPIGFVYRTYDPFDCENVLTLDLLGKTLSFPGSSTAWYPGVDNHTFTAPDLTITVPATVTLEKG